MDPPVPLPVLVFAAVYLGMALGRVPGLAIDRTGVALLGLIALLATQTLTIDQAGAAVDISTIALLFALMIVSAQFQASGFYTACAHAITRTAGTPARLLAGLIAVTGALSAVLTNDVVAFALAPPVCAGLMARGLDPRPYLVALAGAANAGSAATLIGNPQNILIGQMGGAGFWTYALHAAPIAVLALVCVHVAVRWTWREALAGPAKTPFQLPAAQLSGTRQPGPPMPAPEPVGPVTDRFQMLKGALGLALLIGLFATGLPREIGALAVAGLLLLSRRTASRDMIGAVDWHLLLLFVCLFGVTAAFAQTGLTQEALAGMAGRGWSPETIAVMAPATLALSNGIGNVPAVILILTLLPDLSHGALIALGVLSTLAGNLLLTGSLANIIVAERAAASGVRLSFMDYARSGIPMTLASMAIACAMLAGFGLARV